jgi:hypothetical protein
VDGLEQRGAAPARGAAEATQARALLAAAHEIRGLDLSSANARGLSLDLFSRRMRRSLLLALYPARSSPLPALGW